MIANNIKEYINANIKTYAVLTLDALNDDIRAICLQQLPSTPKVKKFLYGASEGELDFRVLARHEEKFTACEQLEALIDYFYSYKNIPLDSRTTISLEATATPTIFEITEKEYYVYQAQFKLTYKQKGVF